MTPPRPKKANGPHVVGVEREMTDGNSRARAVCSCGWKGHWEKFFRTAHTQGAKHKGVAGDD